MVSEEKRSILRQKVLDFRALCAERLEGMGLDSTTLPHVALEEKGPDVPRDELFAAANEPTTNPTIKRAAREDLKALAQDTLKRLPQLLTPIGKMDHAKFARKYTFDDHPDLSRSNRPTTPTLVKIRVINSDSLNAALDQIYATKVNDSSASDMLPRPLVVNFANAFTPGGGWLNGAMAQEEEICFRSSLSLSLQQKHYPLKMTDVLYNPYVMVMRNDQASGHWPPAPTTRPEDLPIVSAVTVAALRDPRLKNQDGGKRFALATDREITKRKMRLTLQIAAAYGHRMLVLGALGCGVFANPPEDIAECWLEVLSEPEFKGKWWSDVCFAVFDPKRDGNLGIFQRILDGQEV